MSQYTIGNFVSSLKSGPPLVGARGKLPPLPPPLGGPVAVNTLPIISRLKMFASQRWTAMSRFWQYATMIECNVTSSWRSGLSQRNEFCLYQTLGRRLVMAWLHRYPDCMRQVAAMQIVRCTALENKRCTRSLKDQSATKKLLYNWEKVSLSIKSSF